MRSLALDIGEARVGVAVSDAGGRVASPLTVLDARSRLSDRVAAIVDEYGAEEVVVGLPIGLSGDEGPQARRVRDAAAALASALDVPVTFWDERLSSAEARRVLTAGGVSDRKKRGKVDMIAAALVLQSYLDSKAVSDG